MRSRHQEAVKQAASAFSGHRLSACPARSWTMRDPAKGCAYSFIITWSPGTLCLSGDIGEMVIRHVDLCDLWGGIFWLSPRHTDFDYIMSKSDQRRQYDENATFAEFIRVCNDDAIEGVKARRYSLREYRRDKATAKREFEAEMIAWEAREHDRQHRCHEGEPEDPKPTMEEFEDRFVSDPAFYDMGPLEIDYTRGLCNRCVPDGWEWWDKLREAVSSYRDEREIFTASGRRQIKRDLRSELENGGAQRAYEIGSEMGLSDFYPVENWTQHHRFQFEALQLWAKTMKAQEPRWHRAWRALKRARVWVKRLPDRWDRTHIRPDLWWVEDTSSKRIVAEDGSESWVQVPNGRIDKQTLWIKKPHRKKDGSVWHQLAAVKPWNWRGRVVPGVWTEAGRYWGDAASHTIHPVPGFNNINKRLKNA